MVKDRVGRYRWARGEKVTGTSAFSAVTLLVGRQDPASRLLKVGCWFVGGHDSTGAVDSVAQ